LRAAVLLSSYDLLCYLPVFLFDKNLHFTYLAYIYRIWADFG